MRLVLAQMKHETNTFSPVPTPLARFGHGRDLPWEGEEALAEFRGTGTALGAFIELAERAGAEIVLPVAAQAWPSGRVAQDAYEFIAGKIVAAVAKGCDAVLLDLHGAMVTERFDDGEGELLARLRRVAPKVPIGVAHDMHANLFPAAGRVATSLAGYQTYPHVDMHETGVRAARPILGLLENSCHPTLAFGHKPMLPHVMRQSSLDSPNREIQARAQEMEKQGALTATFFVGFPHADIPYAGSSAVVVTDGDAELARRYCDELLEMGWKAREQFVYTPEPLAQSMEKAKAAQGRPVVLLDHYDNCASGGTMDCMTVLEAILEARLEEVAAFAVCDPAAVKRLAEAGAGASVTLELGGRTDMPSLGLKGRPLAVSGKVKRLVEGRYRNEGPMGRGELMDMGPSAVLDTGRVEIAVISRQVEPYDIAAWRHLGIDPAAKRYVMLKSRVHWRAGLGDLAKAVIECAGTGVCTSDYSQLNFRRVRRPVFPLDPL
ncbi:MAG TPA: M81 family metallopeptidase [Burkholderiales bacterium]|jgi:microcystin degradation protein MlrC|nr:M81 family metallopeptidase [Burkholderiales bacterium]